MSQNKSNNANVKIKKKGFWKIEQKNRGANTKKQRNVCVYLFKKAKKDHYENINISNLTDSNKFWKTVRPIFGSKIKSKNSITLVEGTKSSQDEGELAKKIQQVFC